MTLPAPIDLGVRRIGFLSDSHGDALATRRAVRALVEAGAETLIHLGDVCSDAVLDELVVAGADGRDPLPARVFIGNMDLDPDEFRRCAGAVGVLVDDPAVVYRSNGALIVAQHGHHRGVDRQAREIGADFYVQGHSHRVCDAVVTGLRVLNPGALHRAERYTCALLDTGTGEFSVIDIGKGDHR